MPAEQAVQVNHPIRRFDAGMGATIAAWMRWGQGAGPLLSGPRFSPLYLDGTDDGMPLAAEVAQLRAPPPAILPAGAKSTGNSIARAHRFRGNRSALTPQ